MFRVAKKPGILEKLKFENLGKNYLEKLGILTKFYM